MLENIRNVKYELITSSDKQLKEVMVTYTYKGSKYCYYIFIRIEANLTDKDYLQKAEKIFNKEVSEKEILKSSKKLRKTAASSPLLVTLAIVLGIATVGLGGFLTYQYLNSTPGGGEVYKPGQEVDVNPEVNDPSGNYRVTFGETKAVVGEEFNTTINLIPQNPSTKTYFLPDKLVSVLSYTTILKEEQYVYTLDTTTKTSATLKILAENVYGPIVINLALVESGDKPKPGEIVDVTADAIDPSSCYKITYDDKDKPNRATVGKDYSTTIKITKEKENVDNYTLPDKLSSVVSGSSILKVGEGFTYTLDETKMIATLQIPGKCIEDKIYFSFDLTLVQPEPVPPVITGDPREPLAFICNSDNAEIDISYKSKGNFTQREKIDLWYRVDKGAWLQVENLKSSKNDYSIVVKTDIKKGQEIQFRGTNDYWSYVSSNSNKELLSFVAKGDFFVCNNVMSLLKRESEKFRSLVDLSGKKGCFAHLFESEKNGIVDANGLWLQATTLDKYVYDAMFSGCERLLHAPIELPAISLKECDCCYYEMFKDCKLLVNTPNLFFSKTTDPLPPSCCESMFSGCASLTIAPTICASSLTQLSSYCFRAMFKDCIKLNNPPHNYLETTHLAEGCYQEMFEGCTSLTDLFLSNAPSFLPADKLENGCYAAMFNGCTSLVEAPSQISSDYETGQLAERCCVGMFYGCTSLTKAPLLPSTKLADQCYENMFNGCESLEIAPYLPATTEQLKNPGSETGFFSFCYEYIFGNCHKLKSVSVGFSTEDDGSFPGWIVTDEQFVCTDYWLASAGSTVEEKTFEWNGPCDDLKFQRLTSTIPSGWTITNPK